MAYHTFIHTRHLCHGKNSRSIRKHIYTLHQRHLYHWYRETAGCPAAQRYHDEKVVDRFGLFGAVIGFLTGWLAVGLLTGLVGMLAGVLLGALLGRIIVIFK
jgi:hypothetical protein